jgi:hypothetical protein
LQRHYASAAILAGKKKKAGGTRFLRALFSPFLLDLLHNSSLRMSFCGVRFFMPARLAWRRWLCLLLGEHRWRARRLDFSRSSSFDLALSPWNVDGARKGSGGLRARGVRHLTGC